MEIRVQCDGVDVEVTDNYLSEITAASHEFVKITEATEDQKESYLVKLRNAVDELEKHLLMCKEA